jgi:phosphoribosylanthranilate isomerase
VFVDQAIEEINAIAAEVGLGAVQLHGDESVSVCAGSHRRVIKAVRLSAGSQADAVDTIWSEATLLLDAFDPEHRGGTGRQVDWTLAGRIAHRRRTILSGGLRADNVCEAIRRVAPYGLDVSSGVESRPGIKDAERMRAFFDAVKTAAGANKPGLARAAATVGACDL